jgi:DNA integrity scanning protein DisA with diadenylate cyclase activity
MDSIISKLLIFNWKDAVEIAFFVSTFYYFSAWLAKDKTKNLVMGFYGYSTLVVLTHFINLSNVNYLLIAAFPAAIMFLFLVHQKELQKNFITFQNIKPKVKNLDWIDIILRAAVTAVDNNKHFLCLIEGKDSLKGFINTEMRADSELNESLIDVLIKSPMFNQDKIVWVSNGKLLAINADWDIENKKVWVAEKSKLEEWKQNGILFSSKTDAIIFKAYPDKRCFDIIARGKISEQVTINNGLSIINQYVRKNYSQIYKKEYENKSSKIKQANT